MRYSRRWQASPYVPCQIGMRRPRPLMVNSSPKRMKGLVKFDVEGMKRAPRRGLNCNQIDSSQKARCSLTTFFLEQISSTTDPDRFINSAITVAGWHQDRNIDLAHLLIR